MFTARYVLHSTFCPHSVFMCFVWIWEQTAIISLHSIDWLVFITETECVYCAVRSTFYVLSTQCIYVFCVDLRTNSDYFTVQQWQVGFYNWDGVCLLRGTFYILRSAHSVFMCFVWIWEHRAIISLYSIDWLVFITETECLLRGKFYILRSAHTVYLCVLCGSENKQRLFHCTALTGWLVFRPFRKLQNLRLVSLRLSVRPSVFLSATTTRLPLDGYSYD